MYYPIINILQEYNALRSQINNMFDEKQWIRNQQDYQDPLTNVYELKDGKLRMVMLIPGIDKEKLQIQLHQNKLFIAGVREDREHNPSERIRQERTFGEFTRAIHLPYHVNPETFSATYLDGVLTIEADRAEESKPRKITVN